MRKKSILGLTLLGSALAVVITSVTCAVYAGGPLFTFVNSSGQRQVVTWPQPTNGGASLLPVTGGPLNLTDVTTTGQVVYRVDANPLGQLDNATAVEIVDHIFGQYNAIPTSTLQTMDGGPIVNPKTGKPTKVTSGNVGLFLGATPPGENPIIFSKNIIGDELVLGEFGLLNSIGPYQTEGFVMLNGKSLTKGIVSTTSFIGVFQHEFGHFVGPLDHEQSNGIIGDGNLTEPGFEDPGAAFDLFAPFTETLYPFIYSAPFDSNLGTQFPDSGYFIATLDMDSQNAISGLYPTAAYSSTLGSIAGEVVVPANLTGGGSEGVALQGINVIARQMPPGAVYPPLPTTLAFPTAPTLGFMGIPASPSSQVATAPLSVVSSAVTGAQFGVGSYKISGLPPGQYLVQIQDLDPNEVGGSSVGQTIQTSTRQMFFPAIEEFYNGTTSSNSPSTFTLVNVTAGTTTQNINLFINGLTSNLQSVSQIPGNNTKATAQPVQIGSEITGSVSLTDPSQLKVNFGGGNLEAVQNLYVITLSTTQNLLFTLDGSVDTSATNGESNNDIDLFVWDSGVNKKKSSPSDSHLMAASSGPTPHEAVGEVQLGPGTYYIGVACATGSQPNYKLRIFAEQ